MVQNSGNDRWWIAPVAFALLASPGCEQADAGQGWIQHSNPAGFALEHPQGWKVEMTEGKPIQVSSADKSSFVIVQPAIAAEGETAESWVRGLPQRFASVFPNAHIDGIRQGRRDPDEAVADLSFTQGGLQMRGRALCWIQQRSLMLYAVAAPSPRFEQEKDNLLHVLNTFRFTTPAAGQNAAAPSGPQYVAWRDPVEGGFTLEVPSGWQVRGGVARIAPVDVRSGLDATSPDGQIHIQIGDTRIPAFTLPNSLLAMAGLREGNWYSPGYGVNMMVMHYMPGAQFARSHAQNVAAQGASGLRFTRQQDRSDTAAALNQVYAQFSQMGGTLHMDAGEVAFEYSRNGQPMQGYYFAGTLLLQTQGTPGGLWQVPHLYGYTATAEKAAEAESIMKHMVETYRIDPDWANRNSQIAANVSQIVTRTNAEIMKIWRTSTDYRNRTVDDINRRFDNHILGVVDVEDPITHETWKVEAGHSYYFRKQTAGGNAFLGNETGYAPADFNLLRQF